MQLDHINIKAPEALLEEVRDFYCAVLGLQEGARPNFSSPGYWLYAGVRAFTARLEAQGVDYRSSHIPELALTQLFFSDPAGTGLEINFAGETRV